MTLDLSQATVDPGVLGDGVARYSMDDADVSSGTLTDTFGGNDASINGATTGVSTPVGYAGEAFTFDGDDDYLNCGTQLVTTSEITFSVWVNLRTISDNTGVGFVVERYVPSQTSIQFQLGMAGDSNWRGDGDKFTAGFYDGGWRTAVGRTPIAGRWYNVVGTYDGQEVRLYVNGVLEASTAYTGGLPSPNEEYWIGTRHHGSDGPIHFDGEMTEVRIYDRALSPQEVFTLYGIGRYGVPDLLGAR